MRNLHLTTILLTGISLLALGCRQTSGPVPGGPLSPNGLAPVTGQNPALNPFGGATRVTPPATGSYSASSNYMSGVAPIAQTGGTFNSINGVAPAGGFANQGDVIGSGVQSAGWNETTSRLNSQPSQAPDFGVNSSVRDPRGGGMRTIDLTGAPAPPGYQPNIQSFTPAPSNFAPANQQPFQQRQQFQPQQQQFQQRQQFQPQPTFRQGVQTINVPSQGQIANQPAGNSLRTATAPGPSTDPVGNTVGGTSGQDNLPWRRPDTRF
ncbi:MAG: hypothetical protein AB8B91_00625 [Rubripirellula sp.]